MHSDSQVIVNTHKIYPSPVATGKMDYPEDVLGELTSRNIKVKELDAFEVARKVGEVKAVNIVMVGVLSTYIAIDEQVFLDVMNERIPERFREANIKAFQEGRKIAVA
jgi:indolepyruvate ferredoxin oxidoreductase beta subunit